MPGASVPLGTGSAAPRFRLLDTVPADVLTGLIVGAAKAGASRGAVAGPLRVEAAARRGGCALLYVTAEKVSTCTQVATVAYGL